MAENRNPRSLIGCYRTSEIRGRKRHVRIWPNRKHPSAAPRAQPVLLFAAPCLFGVIGHLIGLAMTAGALDVAFVNGSTSRLSLPLPIDYAAGSLLGVSVGVGWARSFLHEEEPLLSPPTTDPTR